MEHNRKAFYKKASVSLEVAWKEGCLCIKKGAGEMY